MRGVRVIVGRRELAVLELEPVAPGNLDRLTANEREVARLAIEGLSNREIASRRGTAERTVANQLASIYRKLEIGSRIELAARARPKK